MTAEEYFGKWSRVVDVPEAKRIISQLSSSSTCPLLRNVFKSFQLCPLDSLKVVVLGQDPYPTLKKTVHEGRTFTHPVATGLAFANSADTLPESYSASLGVLIDSVIDFTVPHGTINFDPSLENWEVQGVLLLNAALSCSPGKPGSHMLLWRPFIKSLLVNLSSCMTGIVYVLMGTEAQSFESCINAKTNHIIRIRHPSYYARTNTRMPNIWKEINQILKGMYGTEIEWYKESQ